MCKEENNEIDIAGLLKGYLAEKPCTLAELKEKATKELGVGSGNSSHHGAVGLAVSAEAVGLNLDPDVKFDTQSGKYSIRQE